MSHKSSEETVASGMLSKRERFGFTMLFAAAVGFGLAPSCAKLAYGAGAEPLTLVAARFGLCLFAIGVVIRIRRTSLTIERGLFVGSLVMGWYISAACAQSPVFTTTLASLKSS